MKHRFKKTVLAALGCVAVLGSLLALPAKADNSAAAVADDRTLNTWDTVNFAKDTKNTGRIWTDKSVSTDSIQLKYGGLEGTSIVKTEGSDFLVALSALSNTSSITTNQSIPLDIMLVLDESGSMAYQLGSDSNASRSAIDASTMRKELTYYIRSSSGGGPGGNNNYTSITWDESREKWGYSSWGGNWTEVVPENTTIYQYASRRVALQTAALNFVDATAAMNATAAADKQHRIGVVSFASSANTDLALTTDMDAVASAIGSLAQSGATNAADGMDLAESALRNARSDAKKVVIFFTDGVPTTQSDFNTTVAYNAVDAARNIKNDGGIVYSVSVYSQANPSNTTSNINKFLHAVSSNYPSVTGTSWSGLSLGARNADGKDYFMATTDAAQLSEIFSDIFKSITSSAQSPTTVTTGNPQASGYITFSDTLGAFVEVKDVNAIVYDDVVYSRKSVSTNADGAEVYAFEGNVTDVNHAHPGTYALSHLLVKVYPGATEAEGDRVIVHIPAALLPLRYFNIDANNNLTITEAHPVRVLYSVGLKAGVAEAMASGDTGAVEGLTEYIRQNAKDGEISFYSNEWTGGQMGNTAVNFNPATSNPYYYHVNDTILYTDANCTNPLKSDPVQGTTYYYQHPYHAETASGDVQTHTPVEAVAGSNSSSVVGQMADGTRYVKAGTAKSSFATADGFFTPKASGANKSGTADYSFYPTWNTGSGIVTNYLGNNGKLTYTATGSLAISKSVTADEGLTAPDAEFTFDIALTGTELGGTYATELTSAGSTEITDGTITINAEGKGTATLKAGQTLTIHGIPDSVKYTVTETNLPGGFTQTAPMNEMAVPAEGSIQAGTAQPADFTNHYSVQPATLSTGFPAQKVVQDASGNVMEWNGHGWQFTFHIAAEGTVQADGTIINAQGNVVPMPANRNVTIKAANETAVFGFEGVEFTKPGTYIYGIVESHPQTEGERMAGINYSQANYRLEVVVTDNGQGQLVAAPALYWVAKDDGTVITPAAEAEVAVFTNTYVLENVQAGPRAFKSFVDKSGARTNPNDGEFRFSINAVAAKHTNDGADIALTEVPAVGNGTGTNTAAGVVNFGTGTFTHEDVGHTYFYEIREVIPVGAVDAEMDGKTFSKVGNTYYSKGAYVAMVQVIAKKVEGDQDAVAINATYFSGEFNADLIATANGTTTYGGTAISYLDANGRSNLLFTNIYVPTPATAEGFQVRKTLTGRDWKEGETFSYTLTGLNNAPMPASALLEVGKDGASFGTITYDKVGTYTYQITENTPADTKGITYDTHTATVTVTVTDNNGQLVASVAYSNANALTDADKAVTDTAAFTNTYKAGEVTMTPASLLVQKTLAGSEWISTDQFLFRLYFDGNIPRPVNRELDITFDDHHADGTSDVMAFDDQNIVYTAAGTYTYYIVEQPGTIPGMTYDRTVYRIQVKVVDDQNGSLKVDSVVYGTAKLPEGVTLSELNVDGVAELKKLTYTNGNDTVARFTNTYKAAAVTVSSIHARKTLVGRDMTADEFQIVLEAVSDNAKALLPNAITGTHAAATDGSGARVSFNVGGQPLALTFTEAGIYTFKISETKGNAANMTYDGSVCTVTVTVTDNLAAGQLEAAVAYVQDGHSGLAHAEFLNIYYNKDEAKKVYSGDTAIGGQLVSAGQELTYTVDWANTAVDAAGKPVAATVTITDGIPTGTTYVSGSADNDGVYENGQITWTIDAAAGQKGTVSFKVTVDDAPNGAKIENQASIQIGENDPFVTNKVHNDVPGKTVAKDGKPVDEIKVGDILTYTITYSNPTDSTATVTITDKLDSALAFVSADNGGSYKDGTITWTLNNVASTKDLPVEEYPTVSFTARVTETAVEKATTNQASVNLGHEATTNVVSIPELKTGTLIFRKVVETAAGVTAPDAQFAFNGTFVDTSGVNLTGIYAYTVSNGATGETGPNGQSMLLRHGEYMTFTGIPVGTEVTIFESDIPAGFVAKDGKGSQTITITEGVNELTFTNVFTPAVLEGSEKLKIGKDIMAAGTEMTDWPDGYTFSFRISALRENETIPMPANTIVTLTEAQQTGSFGDITFTEEGTYYYAITEIHPVGGTDDPRLHGISYSHANYVVEVKVENDNGVLTATSTMTNTVTDAGAGANAAVANNTALFKNTYDLGSETWGPSVEKHYINTADPSYILPAGKFHFNIELVKVYDNDDSAKTNVMDTAAISLPTFFGTATNGEAGIVNFGTVAFETEHVGYTFVYKFYEVVGATPNMDYDTAPRYAVVKVYMDGAGENASVAVEVVYASDINGTNIISGNEVIITNTYDPEPAKANFSAKKDVVGREWLKDESFQFTLTGVNGAPMPADSANGTKTITVYNENALSFGDITFDKVGDFYYEIHEVIGNTAGLTYDTHIARIKVTVSSDRDNGRLLAALNDGTAAVTAAHTETFTNTYSTGTATLARLDVTKVLNGRAWQDSDAFEIVLTGENGAPMPTATKLTLTSAKQSGSFGPITYTKPGTYTYTIAETDGKAGGMTYDTNKYEVEVEVTDDGYGTLTATASTTALTFTNEYKTGTISASIPVTKILSGDRDWLDTDEFIFELYSGSTKVDTVTIKGTDAEKKATFKTLTFSAPGTYTYTVKEVKGSIPGITYDESVKTVTVRVTDNMDGTLAAVINGTASFTNTYDYGTVTFSGIQVTKVLEGRSWQSTDRFTFTIEAQDNAPESANKSLTITRDVADHTARFGSITFTAPGTYKYIIRETKGSIAGIAYDESAYEVTIKVEDVGGKLAVTAVNDVPNATVSTATFTNTYSTGTVSVTVPVTKTLTGRDWKDTDVFEFELYSGTTKRGTATIEGTDTEKKTSFGLTFSAPGTYTYTVKEVAGSIPGIVYDTSAKTITVEVKDNLDGTLSASVTGTASFTNRYETGTVSVSIPVTKTLSGDRGWLDTDVFEFELYSGTNKRGTAVIRGTDGEKKAYFDALTFSAPGTYTYTVKEVAGSIPGITYDTSEKNISVVVTDNGDGTLSAVINGTAAFTNTYEYGTVTFAGIQVTKVLDGRSWLETDSFTFTIEPLDNAPAPASKSLTIGGVTNHTAQFDGIIFTAPGTYKYRISETKGSIAGIAYDESAYEVTIKVEDVGGKLAVTAVNDVANATVSTATFTNTYTTGTVSVTIPVTKTLTGRDWEDTDVFEFELYSGTNKRSTAEIEGKDAEKKTSFGLTFSAPGTYTYTVKETAGSIEGILYDAEPKTITVTVTDNMDGTLAAKVSGTASFTNDFVTEKLVAPVNPSLGETVTYTITYRNPNETAAKITITDKLSENLDYIAGSASKGGVYADGTITWEFEAQAGEEGEVTFQAKLNAKAIELITENHATVKVGEHETKTNIVTVGKISHGSLTIQKVVTTPAGITAPNAYFAFTVDLTGATGTYPYTTSSGGSGTIQNGGVISLKGGESATINGIPVGMQYQISENSSAYFTQESVTNSGMGTVSAEGTTVTFVNSYKPEKAEAAIQVQKVLTGREWQTDESFTFSLTGSGESETVTVYDGNAVTIGSFSYNVPGTYTYQITETKGVAVGMIYDDSIKTVTVKVEDNKEGKLVATVDYGSTAEAAVFTNHYVTEKTANYATARPPVLGEIVNYTIEYRNPYDYATTILITDELSKNLDYVAGTATDGGIYDEQEHAIVWSLPVEANESGAVTFQAKLNAGAVYDVTENWGIMEIDGEHWVKTNVVEIEQIGTGSLTISKAVTTDSGVVIPNDTFTFQVQLSNEAEARTVTIDVKDGKSEPVTIGEIPVGVTYTVREILPEGTKFTSSGDVTGTIGAKGETYTAAFVNTYDPDDITVTVSATKILENAPLQADQFSFTLYDANGEKVSAVTNDGNGDIIFPAITFVKVGTYSYTIRENVDPEAKHIAYDVNDTRNVEIIVSDNGDGTLGYTVNYDGSDAIPVFVNSYKDGYTVGSFTIEASKTLTGRELNEGEFFFEVIDDATGEQVAIGSNVAGGKIALPTMTLFALLDEELEPAPVLPDPTLDVTVQDASAVYAELNELAIPLTEEEQGLLDAGEALHVQISVSGSGVSDADKALIEAALGDASAAQYLDIRLTKTIAGMQTELDVTDEAVKLTFTVSDGGSRIYNVIRVHNGEAQLLEDLDGDGNDTVTILTDRFSAFALVYTDMTVEEETEETEATEPTEITEETEPTETTEAAEPSEETEPAETTEATEETQPTETAEATEPQVQSLDETEPTEETEATEAAEASEETQPTETEAAEAETTVEPVAPTGENAITSALRTVYSIFRLSSTETEPAETEAEGPVLREAVTRAVTESRILKSTAPEGGMDIVVETAGDYWYTVREVNTGMGGVTYDGNVYKVKVTVVDDHGNLVVTAPEYYDADGVLLDHQEIEFHNTYSAAPVVVTIDASKTMSGRNLADKEFTFELVDMDNQVVATAQNDAAGKITFTKKFTEAGVYTYRVYEVKGSDPNVDYDKSGYRVDVTVTDNLEGNLVAKVDYPEGGVNFLNTFVEPKPVSVEISAKKILMNTYLDQMAPFTFLLKNAAGETIATAQNDSQGNIRFNLTYTYAQAGTYEYSISEINDGRENFIYDGAEQEVVIEVYDNGNRQMAADVTYVSGTAVFTNYYKAPLDVALHVNKVLEGREMLNSEFTFTLIDRNEGEMYTGYNDIDGDVYLGTFTYTSAGTYEYNVYEVVGAQKGVTYDMSKYTILVTVREDANHVLSYSIRYLDSDGQEIEDVTFVNTYKKTADNSDPTNPKTGDSVMLPLLLVVCFGSAGAVLTLGKRKYMR